MSTPPQAVLVGTDSTDSTAWWYGIGATVLTLTAAGVVRLPWPSIGIAAINE